MFWHWESWWHFDIGNLVDILTENLVDIFWLWESTFGILLTFWLWESCWQWESSFCFRREDAVYLCRCIQKSLVIRWVTNWSIDYLSLSLSVQKGSWGCLKAIPLSGISGLFFYLVLLHFLSCPFSSTNSLFSRWREREAVGCVMCVCACMCVYIHVCVHACMHECVCVHACMYICLCVHVYIYMCVCVCAHKCMCVCVWLCVRVCTCVSVWMWGERERQSEICHSLIVIHYEN